MISSVRGEVLSVGLDHAVVEMGGVGLAVHATPATLSRLRRGQDARLETALVVREDSLTLYGFADAAERELFALLQTVSGIGPRLALAALAVLTPDALSAALAEGAVATLTSVPGIGRKGAERLVLELRDKVVGPAGRDGSGGLDTAAGGGAGHGGPGGPVVAAGTVRGQVVEALVGLGFAARPAEKAVDEVLGGAADTARTDGTPDTAPDPSALLRSALTRLGPG